MQKSSHPPTWYPRGVPVDCATDGKSGEWVHTGDAQGTLFFFPFHDLGGIPRRTLVNEALAARSDRRLREIEEEDHALQREMASDLATKGPVIIAMTPMVAILGWLIGADEAVELYPELR